MDYTGMTKEQLEAHMRDTKDKIMELERASVNIKDVIGMLYDDTIEIANALNGR